MNRLSLYQVAISAMEELHLQDTSETAWFMKRANDGARRLKCWETLIQESDELFIDNEGRSCLPCGFYRMLAIQVCREPCENIQETNNNHVNPINSRPWALFYMDAPLLNTCGINTGGYCGGSGSYYVNGDTLQIFGVRNCKIRLAYMSYNVDAQGHMIVLPEWEEYMVNYLGYLYARAFPERYPAYIMNEFKKEYTALARGIRGDSQLRQMMNQKPKIQSIMNSYIGQKNIYSL